MNPDRGIPAPADRYGASPGSTRAFLGDPRRCSPAIAFVDNWHWWGFLMVLFLAGDAKHPSRSL